MANWIAIELQSRYKNAIFVVVYKQQQMKILFIFSLQVGPSALLAFVDNTLLIRISDNQINFANEIICKIAL